MGKSQELKRSALFLAIIFVALISLSRSDSIMTVTEGEVAKMEFPYPCDSEIVTIRNANRDPFYSSTDHAQSNHLQLPSYQVKRFSVEKSNCSVQVEINPVMRQDGATYICIAYKDSRIHGDLIRVRLNVDYPPGIVSCVPSDKNKVGDWVPLECQASVGSLDGEIVCYQDAKRLPPDNGLHQTGEIWKQTIWATKEYPVFCCSSIPDQPKDMCECNDFSWDPSYIESVLHPCPSTTPRLLTTMKDKLGQTSTDHPFPTTSTPLTSKTTPNKVHLSPWLWGFVLAITTLLVVSLVLICLRCKGKCKSRYTDSTKRKVVWVTTEISPMPRTRTKTYAGFQIIPPENIHHMHTGVYRCHENTGYTDTEKFLESPLSL